MDLSGLTKMHVTFKTKQRHNEINTYKKYFVRVYNAIMPCLMGTSTTYIIYVCMLICLHAVICALIGKVVLAVRDS